MKLCFIIRDLDYGGAQRQLISLVNNLDPKKFDITLIVFYLTDKLEKDLITNKVKLISLNKKGRWDLFYFFFYLVKILKKINPDIIHSYLSSPNLLTIFLKPIFPHVKIVWGLRNSSMNISRYDWLYVLNLQLESFFSFFPDLIIANSYKAKENYLKRKYPPQKIKVIPNGINTEKFKPDGDARIALRREWNITDHEILIGLIARLDPMKDHPNFLRGAKLLLSQTSQNIRFVCVGEGSPIYTQKLYQLTEELNLQNKLIWAGARNDMIAVYNALDFSTLTSIDGEGFSNAIGEAMACGKPCVVTDVGDSALVVGEIGIIVPPNNPEALVQAWQKMLQMNRDKIGIEARNRILHNFSINNLCNKTGEVLLQLFNENDLELPIH